MATSNDFKIAAAAAGFTLGFGLLTVWEAIKQTKRNRNPLRSAYIYMVWGEILANLIIGIIGWLFLNGVFAPSVPLFVVILLCWVFEVQLLMQIIVNRIAIIAEHGKTIRNLKWGTAIVISCINVAVFCIFIPAHLDPPASQTFVNINKYWDRTSKVLILIVDAALNWYFLRIVKIRLLDQNRLSKYKPLVGFNAKLMVISIGMDVFLIALMSLPNPVVFIQFHPLVYLVKLNIEMSMAQLITRLARSGTSDEHYPSLSNSNHQSQSNRAGNVDTWGHGNAVAMTHRSKIVSGGSDKDVPVAMDSHVGTPGIHRRTDIEVRVESHSEDPFNSPRGGTRGRHNVDDEIPLTGDAGHPKMGVRVEQRGMANSQSSGES